MNDFVIYHNSRCSKSRAALEFLRGKSIEPKIVEYLKTPPSEAELRELLRKLGLTPRDILRDGEEDFARLKLEDPKRTDDELIAAIAKHPVLLQRPIIVRGKRAVIGRPTENIQELL